MAWGATLKRNRVFIQKTTHQATMVFGLFILTCIIIFLLTTTSTAYHKNNQLKQYAFSLDQETQVLKNNHHQLRREITALNSDPVYLELLMRKDLKMLQEDEIIIKR